jgi:signal transduction histidine kinase
VFGQDQPHGFATEEVKRKLWAASSAYVSVLYPRAGFGLAEHEATHEELEALAKVLREIGARYAGGPVEVVVAIDYADNVEPATPRRPDLVQALGTLIENAASFAHTRIDIRVWSDARTVGIDIIDDGPGFAPEILARLGEPYVSSRVGESDHMGLGIFIAATLLARMSASVAWDNAPHGGARIVVTWLRPAFSALSEKKLA